MNWLDRLFAFERNGTTLSREVIAGLTTFTTMSYIVVVNPAILANAGIPEGSFITGTLTTAGGGVPNGSEQVSFEVKPNEDDMRPHPTQGQGITAWLDLHSTSPDFTIERVMLSYESRSLFGA